MATLCEAMNSVLKINRGGALGRPLKFGEPLVKREIRLPKSLSERLSKIAIDRGREMSDVVRDALNKEFDDTKRLPVLGTIVCGTPAQIAEHAEEYVDVREVLKPKPGDYLLIAQGDSMTGGGIEPGDLLHMRNQQVCDYSGQIAAVLVESGSGWQSTLKRVEYEPGSPLVCLRAMNPKHKDIQVNTKEAEVKICGVFKGLIRRDG